MPTLEHRRLEFRQGKSNKFYELALEHHDNDTYGVHVRFGRIGTNGQNKVHLFSREHLARRKFSALLSEKLGKGYVSVTATSTAGLLRQTKVSLPDSWTSVSEKLTPGERYIYENYNDQNTKERRQSIISTYLGLVERKTAIEKISQAREIGWELLRFLHLSYLASRCAYPSTVDDLASSTITSMRRDLTQKPDWCVAEVRSIMSQSKPRDLASPKDVESKISSMVSKLASDVLEEESIGAGGVSRMRARMIAQRRKENEEKNGTSK